MNRVQVVWSRFSVRLLSFVHAKTVYRYGCMYTEMRDMGLYDVPLSMSVGFWDGDYVSQLPYAW